MKNKTFLIRQTHSLGKISKAVEDSISGGVRNTREALNTDG